MTRQSLIIIFIIVTSFFLVTNVQGQNDNSVNWLTFEQLEDSLNINPKPVFVDFYTGWCTFCRKMDKVVFTKKGVIEKLNTDYYAVRFNAESDQTINFGEKDFINDQIGKSRNPVHQIAQLLALNNGRFVPPTLVILDKSFNVTARYFEYLDSERLLEVLNE